MIISLIASFHIFFLQSNSPPSSPRGNSRNSQVNGSTRPNSQEQLSDVSTSLAAFVNDAIMIIKHLLILCLIHTLDGFLYVSECICIYTVCDDWFVYHNNTRNTPGAELQFWNVDAFE